MLIKLITSPTQESFTLIFSLNNLRSDFLRWGLIILSMLVWGFSLITFSQSLVNQGKIFILITHLLILTLVLIFLRRSLLFFYFIFEASLIPIAIIILGWGYQPERTQAMVALILYTILASFPLLVIIIFLSQNSNFFFIMRRVEIKHLILRHQLIMILIILGFLVKFPIFFVHLWLPKAHVEAPVIGSIILAALLLKLAGFGIWRLLSRFSSSRRIILIQAIRLRGGALVGILCLRQIDMKVIIAYSSVSHISFAIALLSSGQWIALLRRIFLIVAHGISSSAIFASANLIYEKTHSRNLILTSGILSNLPKFVIFWFLACIGNMGTPPTINFIAETWRIVTLIETELLFVFPVACTIFFAVAFTLVIYCSRIHGQSGLWNKIRLLINRQSWSILFNHALFLFSLTILFI